MQVTAQQNFQQNINNMKAIEQPSSSGLQKQFCPKKGKHKITFRNLLLNIYNTFFRFTFQWWKKRNIRQRIFYFPVIKNILITHLFPPEVPPKHTNIKMFIELNVVFFDEKENDEKGRNTQQRNLRKSKNIKSIGWWPDKDIQETEWDGETQNENVPANLEHDKNYKMHKNKQKNHVTSDGIRNSETIKSDFKVAKKRARNPDKWKRRKAARLRQGEEYIYLKKLIRCAKMLSALCIELEGKK